MKPDDIVNIFLVVINGRFHVILLDILTSAVCVAFKYLQAKYAYITACVWLSISTFCYRYDVRDPV